MCETRFRPRRCSCPTIAGRVSAKHSGVEFLCPCAIGHAFGRVYLHFPTLHFVRYILHIMASILTYSSRVRNKQIVPPSVIGAPERLRSNTKQPQAKEKFATCERLAHVFIGGRSHLTEKDLHPFLAPLMLKAHEVFGKRPRDFQEHGANSLLHKRDLIVKAAPGSGKSLIFLIMSLLRPGAIVLVITPLLVIMNDQAMYCSYHSNGRFRS